MSKAVLSNFLIYCVINALTPGPGNILALNIVTNYGYKKGKVLKPRHKYAVHSQQADFRHCCP